MYRNATDLGCHGVAPLGSQERSRLVFQRPHRQSAGLQESEERVDRHVPPDVPAPPTALHTVLGSPAVRSSPGPRGNLCVAWSFPNLGFAGQARVRFLLCSPPPSPSQQATLRQHGAGSSHVMEQGWWDGLLVCHSRTLGVYGLIVKPFALQLYLRGKDDHEYACRPGEFRSVQARAAMDPAAYKPVLQRLSQSPLMHLRQIAAKALTAFVPVSQLQAEAEVLVEGLDACTPNLNKVPFVPPRSLCHSLPSSFIYSTM